MSKLKPRKCLGCDAVFFSTGIDNRLCQRCKLQAERDSYGAIDAADVPLPRGKDKPLSEWPLMTGVEKGGHR